MLPSHSIHAFASSESLEGACAAGLEDETSAVARAGWRSWQGRTENATSCTPSADSMRVSTTVCAAGCAGGQHCALVHCSGLQVCRAASRATWRRRQLGGSDGSGSGGWRGAPNLDDLSYFGLRRSLHCASACQGYFVRTTQPGSRMRRALQAFGPLLRRITSAASPCSELCAASGLAPAAAAGWPGGGGGAGGGGGPLIPMPWALRSQVCATSAVCLVQRLLSIPAR